MRIVRMVALAAVALGSTALAVEKPSWADAMRRVGAGAGGGPCYVAQFGDSITYSMAFWAPLGWADPGLYIPNDGLPKNPVDRRWRDAIQGCRDKGAEFGNFSGWRVTNLLGVVERVLEGHRPRAAILMIGTNDIQGNIVPPTYRGHLERIVKTCLDARCIPILNTIPPRRDCMKAVEGINKIIKEVAAKFNVPLVDYCAEILRLQPGDACFGTLISEDGVHPTAGRTQDYSAGNLKTSGYALRNWLNFMMFRQVYFTVFAR